MMCQVGYQRWYKNSAPVFNEGVISLCISIAIYPESVKFLAGGGSQKFRELLYSLQSIIPHFYTNGKWSLVALSNAHWWNELHVVKDERNDCMRSIFRKMWLLAACVLFALTLLPGTVLAGSPTRFISFDSTATPEQIGRASCRGRV